MYKNILLTTNVHRRSHSVRKPIMVNKRYKYIIDLLVSTHKTNGKKDAGIISSMRLANNKIRYRTR